MGQGTAGEDLMHWASLNDFLSMGGYALYVWGSYGMMLLLVAAEIFLLLRGQTKVIQRLKRMKNWEEQ
jgi:heme exporter protein D